MITRDEIATIIAECMALQGADPPTDDDATTVLDSIGFIWLQHVLKERFDFDLQPPDGDLLKTLNSARSVHRYLAEIRPDRFVAAD